MAEGNGMVAAWPWRLPIIRHIRYSWHCWRFNRFMRQWVAMGFVPNPQPSDLEYLDGVLHGRY